MGNVAPLPMPKKSGVDGAGFVTSAVEANAPLMKIAEQTRYRSLSMLQAPW
jgi:hypothetical protein